MKTIVILFVLCFAGCGESCRNSPVIETDSRSVEIHLYATGELNVTDYIETDLTGDSYSVSFEGNSNTGYNDYVGMAVFALYNGNSWQNIEVLIGSDYINGTHSYGGINYWTKARITAVLFCEEVTQDTAYIDITNIKIQ